MKNFSNILFQFICAFIGVILISGLPILIEGVQNHTLPFAYYMNAIISSVIDLWPLSDLIISDQLGQFTREIAFYPYVFNSIVYSFEILLLALIAAIICAILGTFLTMSLPQKMRQKVKLIFYFLESIPDILIIMLAQLLVVYIYQHTGTLISKVAVVGDQRIYWLPVLCLMILPMIQLYRLSMLTFEAEERAMYVEFARSLGFSKLFVLFVHIFRNAINSVFNQSKKTMWFMLSNLFILERMFIIPGIMNFLIHNFSHTVLLVTIFSFFIPIYIFYSLGEWYFLRRMQKGGVV